ncbi:polypyrimidine tract binding protein, putative [Plasmodium vivax]|uniref:Polypyrimidine tract binding protein, putative n=1 Tax=Plasmodium vivax TaxID=5855 RepID=A0A1G4H0D2_PLAVI|nr:polypyrimidine tract binding protein, putative [Plasmodium vivax]
MNKRTLSNDENENEKNKTGVKRYLMSNDDPFESQKIFHEKNCASKISANSLIDMKEEDGYVLSDLNSNMNGNENDGEMSCGMGRGTTLMDTTMSNERENTKYGGVTTMGEFGYGGVVGGGCVGNGCVGAGCVPSPCVANSCPANNCVANNCVANNCVANNCVANNCTANSCAANPCTPSDGGVSNQPPNIYYPSDSKKRKGSKYSGMPFLKKEKNCVNTFLVLKNVPRDADEEDIKSFMRPFIKNTSPEIIFDRDGIIVKLYDDELNKNIFNYFDEHPTQIKGSFVSVKLSKLSEDSGGAAVNKENLDEYEGGGVAANAAAGAGQISGQIGQISGQIGQISGQIGQISGQIGGQIGQISGPIGGQMSAPISGQIGGSGSNLGSVGNVPSAKDALEGANKKTGKQNKNESSRVILVSVLNLHYPVDIELIYYLFSKCGTVEKIITFSRNPLIYQALVQFQNIETAQEAIKTLHNRNIYDGCNTIQIQYSFLKELVVKANNSSSRDYTATNLGKNKNLLNLQTSHGVLPTPTRKGNDSELYLMLERKFKLVDFDAKNTSKTPVLICYNIPKDYTDVHKLFNLFSVYGFVSRIKILREKPDSALIQYAGYLFASVAQECLQHAKVGDQVLELHFSKILDIRIAPQQKKIESYKAKTFSSYDQRYLLADQAKYIKGACKPTKTLFISNVSEEVTEECMMNLFMKYGEIKKIKIQPIKEGKKHITITVELSSEDTATRALMDLHNFYLKDRFIKVSYTKTRL